MKAFGSKRANCVAIRPTQSKDSGRTFEIDSSGGAKFRRQHPIGPFVADFCCPQGKLIVELHGGQHAVEVAPDDKWSRFLEAQGYRVLRFWNHDVLQNTEAVLERIAEALSDPHPFPLPGRARVKKNAD